MLFQHYCVILLLINSKFCRMKFNLLETDPVPNLLWFLVAVALFLTGVFGWALGKMNPDIKLYMPPNYKSINKTDSLRGYWKENELHIEFINQKNEPHEKAIKGV